MRRASQDALWRWDAARGRDPFAKGSPPPRPHPIKLLWVLSTVHSAFRSGAGIPEAAPCRHRTMAKGICILGSEAALVAAPRSRLPRRLLFCRLLFCRLLFCNKKSAARMLHPGRAKILRSASQPQPSGCRVCQTPTGLWPRPYPAQAHP